MTSHENEQLRQRAEKRLREIRHPQDPTPTPTESARLIHELRVHQIELELQNEELRRIQESLERTRARYFDLYDLAPVGYITLDQSGIIQEANLAAASLTVTPRTSLIGQPLSRLIHSEDQDVWYLSRQRLRSTGDRQHCELRLQQSDGTTRWTRMDTRLETPTDPNTCSWIILTDITEHKESERQLLETQARLHRMMEIAELSFWEWTPHTNAIYFPPEWRRQTGYGAGELPQGFEEWATLLYPQDRERMLERLDAIAAGRISTCEIQYRLRHKDGDYRWFSARLEPILNDSGHIERILGVHQNVTQRKLAEDQALQLAQHDPLTGLPTRGLLEQLANHMLANAKRTGSQMAVLFVDLDRFKAVNDTYGHTVGDQLLQSVAQRLRETFRAQDLAGRLGGDEFVIVLADIHDGEDAARVAQTAIDSLSRPYLIDALDLVVRPSIGISLYPEDAQTIGDLIKRADLAMYHAKKISPGHYQFLTEALNQQAQTTLALEQRLHEAITQQALRLVYQPMLDFQSGDIVGVEALLRWPQPDGTEIPPLSFLPLAESIGLIHELGQWVFEEVCRQHHAWQKAGLPLVRIEVNVSTRQFRHHSFLSHLAQTLRSSDVEPTVLSLELGEATLLQDLPTARQTLAGLRDLGVRVALADFGMGCSCLSEFDDLSLDRLGINRALVRRLDGPNMQAIVETIVRLGQRLQLDVIAVGIETEEQLDFFRDLGCNQVQGFSLGAPMTGDAFVDWCHDRSAGPC